MVFVLYIPGKPNRIHAGSRDWIRAVWAGFDVLCDLLDMGSVAWVGDVFGRTSVRGVGFGH